MRDVNNPHDDPVLENLMDHAKFTPADLITPLQPISERISG
jgi:hypothetical protein